MVILTTSDLFLYKILELIMVINYSNIDLDRDFLQHFGGMDGNSFINILQTDIETGEDENRNQREIISHSQYYEFEKLISTLTSRKNEFSIFSTNIQSIRATFDELNICIDQLRNLNCEFSAICL